MGINNLSVWIQAVVVDLLDYLSQILVNLGLEELIKVEQDSLNINVVESFLLLSIVVLLRLVRRRVYKIMQQFVVIMSRGYPIHKTLLSNLEVGGLYLVENLIDFLHVKHEILVLIILVRDEMVYVAVLVKV